jgi:hypothetical protein
MSHLFTLAVWTSARKKSVAPIIEELFVKNGVPLAFVWYQERCTETYTEGSVVLVKDLSQVWQSFSRFDASNTVSLPIYRSLVCVAFSCVLTTCMCVAVLVAGYRSWWMTRRRSVSATRPTRRSTRALSAPTTGSARVARLLRGSCVGARSIPWCAASPACWTAARARATASRQARVRRSRRRRRTTSCGGPMEPCARTCCVCTPLGHSRVTPAPMPMSVPMQALGLDRGS